MDIIQKNLSLENFRKFGDAVLIQDNQKPNISGDGWDCWYPLAIVNHNHELSFGIVTSLPNHLQVEYMERHLDRIEYVVAIDHPIIQVVSLNDPLNPDRPSALNAEAFLLQPGQIVLIEKGIWHSAALAFGQDRTSYIFLLGRSTDNSLIQDSGLVQFANNEQLMISAT